MKKIVFSFLFLVCALLCRGQTKQIFLSAPFDKLLIGQTTLKQAEKIVGKPTERRVPPIIEHKSEKQIMLIYGNTKSLLRFGYKRKILYNIELDSGSAITINGNIKLSVTDTNLILETFGTPKEIDRKSTYPYFYYELNTVDVYFSFNDNGILHQASFFKHFGNDNKDNFKEKKNKTLHLYTWGTPAYGEERDSCVILLSKYYGFDEKTKAGCTLTFGQERRWTRHNNRVEKKLKKRYGENWEEKYDAELSKCMN